MPDGSATRAPSLVADPAASPRQPCLGWIVEIDGAGRPRVSFPELVGPPPIARTIGEVPRMQLETAYTEGRAILLGFLDGRADAPVIMSLTTMGFLHAAVPDSQCSASPPRSDTLASLGPYGPAPRLNHAAVPDSQCSASPQRSDTLAQRRPHGPAPRLNHAAEPDSECSVEAEVVVDKEPSVRIIEAREELLLRCGEATISLKADGTIKILGRDVTSWARRRQRIRGGSVAIN